MTPDRIHRLEALDIFAGGVTHELNNALAAVIGFTELCLDEDAPEELRENLKDILQSAERARGLVRQFQAFRQSGERNPEPFETRVLVKEAIKVLRSFIPPHIAIRQSIRGAGMINTDPIAFNRLVMTMGAVAYRFLGHQVGVLEIDLLDMKSTSPSCEIDSNAFTNGYQLLNVRAMISTDKNENRCESTTKKTIAEVAHDSTDFVEELDRLASACGGLILVERRDNNKIGMSLTLPSLAEVKKPASEMKAVDLSLRILFVDDDEQTARMEKKTLERLGHHVEVHHRGAAALTAFNRDPGAFDLVFTDIVMPEMNGDILAREILKIRPDIPVILYSGYIDRNIRERLSSIGAKALLAKPLRREEIADVIRKAVA